MARSSSLGVAIVMAAASVSSSFACSSGSGSASPSTPAGACAEFVAAQREGAQACGKYLVAPGREAELDARVAKQCELATAAPGSGITPAALVSCAAKLRAACGDDDACEDIVVAGTLPDGAACGADSQCASTDCKTPSTSTAPNRCGVCVARVAVGGTCGDTAGSCVKGASCETKGGTTGTCVARLVLAEGDVCYDPAKPSSVPARCADGLACNVEANAPAIVKCTRRGSAGAACASESDCVSELACVNATCGAPGPIGTACTTSSQCANSVCSPEAKKCVAVEWIASGGACDSNVRRCSRGSCSQSPGSGTGTCIDPIPDGAACSNAADSAPSAPRCDRYASCINGTCQIFDASATCK